MHSANSELGTAADTALGSCAQPARVARMRCVIAAGCAKSGSETVGPIAAASLTVAAIARIMRGAARCG